MSKEFDQLVIDTDKGVITKEEALARSYALRVKPNLPGEVTHENIDETFNFLNNENHLADIYQEQIKKDELVKQTQQQNIALQQEIERRDKIDKDRKEKQEKELEAKKQAEKKKKFDSNISVYNSKLSDYCKEQWVILHKEKTWHFWKYLIFILVAVLVIFVLVSLRDKFFNLINIQVTEESKLYYAGIVTAIGFLATAIRSFFDTKNILLGLKILINKKFKYEYMSSNCETFEVVYRKENKEPIIE
jgi:hypothetical protein